MIAFRKPEYDAIDNQNSGDVFFQKSDKPIYFSP